MSYDKDPLPILLWCPECRARHVDEGEFAAKPHHTHSCQSCGMTWRPAVIPTVGVQFLPGFKNQPKVKFVSPNGKDCLLLEGLCSCGAWHDKSELPDDRGEAYREWRGNVYAQEPPTTAPPALPRTEPR